MSTIQDFQDTAVNLTQSILWQYENATNLRSLVDQKNDWYWLYENGFFGYYYFNIFDLRTINDFGAAIWSVILDVPLLVVSEPYEPKLTFGFNQYDPVFPDLLNTYVNFEWGNFEDWMPYLYLSVEQEKFLLRLRYFQLTTRANVSDFDTENPYSINDFLNYLINDSDIGYAGEIHAIDNLDMTMTYDFTNSDFPVSLFNAITLLGIWPRPAGVSINFTGLI